MKISAHSHSIKGTESCSSSYVPTVRQPCVTHGSVRAISQVCALTYGKENKRSLPASHGR